ncbi:MAG: hypothetical protein HC881_20360 [Leptolyngbyaceae cyanobacterium SL_7_1]|nr:hypothetical protein [Leptolyngbyaceae cyanobacterium SL_7_1]
MQIGRFFSLQRGRVGQFLSPRVLVVRTPFRSPRQGGWSEQSHIGFSTLSQAQKFAQLLARMGLRFQLQPSEMLPDCRYEIVLNGQVPLARTLAQWQRQPDAIPALASSDSVSVPVDRGVASQTAIAA